MVKIVEIIQIVKNTNLGLINCFRDFKSGTYLEPERKSYLIFFPYRSKKVRVSEQEARFLFVHNIEKEHVYYSIESPTGVVHNFSSKIGNSRSAESDVMLWELKNEKLSKQINVNKDQNK